VKIPAPNAASRFVEKKFVQFSCIQEVETEVRVHPAKEGVAVDPPGVTEEGISEAGMLQKPPAVSAFLASVCTQLKGS